ncbi:MAG: OmpA family protein [Saprospiraceae bacterium]
MKRFILSSLSILLFLSAAPVFAQNSGKSKSKDRFREKDDPTNVVRVENARFLNSDGNDYSPMYYKNGLVFVSARQKNGPQDKKNGQTFSEIYFAPFDPNGDPIAPSPFSLEINSSLHEGPVAFSRDFQYMFFTRNNMHKGVQKADKEGKVRLKIYMAKRGRFDWIDVKELSFNSDEYSCLHPSLSADNMRLYFASDMPGGEGGFDLWYSDYAPGKGWQQPVNMGPEINTPKNELFPYSHVSGTLFFSSDGHKTLGGLDVFYVDELPDGTSEVVNLDEPFNSKKDDLGFIMSDEGTNGFFASDRDKGYGKVDIFAFNIEKGIEGVERPVSKQVELVVTDAKTGQTIQGAAIRILKMSADGFVSSNQEAYYNIDLSPIQDDESNVVNLQLVRKDASEMGAPDLYTNAAGKAQSDFFKYRSYLLLISMDGYQTEEKLFSFEDDAVGPLTIQLRDAPICHRVNGIVATDQFGTRIVNANLKFTHKETGRQEKVRTNLNGEYEICLPLEGEYLVEAKRTGYKSENATVMVFEGQGSYKEIRLEPTEVASGTTPASASGLKEGSVIVMDRLNFDHNKARLNQKAVRHLDALYDLMKRYPEMEIDLVAHTDVRGEAAENLKLSEERAKNAKAYLVYRGVPEKQINAIGKGEAEPRNRCREGVPCTDDEHQFNVRFEVIVTRIGV